MNRVNVESRETRLVACFKGCAYGATAWLLTARFELLSAQIASLAAVAAGIAISRNSQIRRLRRPVRLAAALVLIGLGLIAERVLGSSELMTGCLGVEASLALCGVAMSALLTLGCLTFLRTLTEIHRVFAVLEACLLGAAVSFVFCGHRDYHIDRPRFVADW
jgi:hypothetical protein